MSARIMEENKNKTFNIRTLDVLRLLIADKKKLCTYSVISGIIGIILAFGTPKVYKSTVTLAPEESGQGFAANASSLASMIGINHTKDTRNLYLPRLSAKPSEESPY